jgi:hypothetical protein
MKRFLAWVERSPDAVGVLIVAAAFVVLAVMERITAWNPPL